jgi:hypothetical protein
MLYTEFSNQNVDSSSRVRESTLYVIVKVPCKLNVSFRFTKRFLEKGDSSSFILQ